MSEHVTCVVLDEVLVNEYIGEAYYTVKGTGSFSTPDDTPRRTRIVTALFIILPLIRKMLAWRVVLALVDPRVVVLAATMAGPPARDHYVVDVALFAIANRVCDCCHGGRLWWRAP